MSINPPPANLPIVKNDLMELPFQLFTQEVARLSVMVGSGSPEGVVEANQARFYMDTSGTAGAILYIKRDSSVGGNPKQGWFLV